eukprot:4610381-Prymnesium_polylepis.1
MDAVARSSPPQRFGRRAHGPAAWLSIAGGHAGQLLSIELMCVVVRTMTHRSARLTIVIALVRYAVILYGVVAWQRGRGGVHDGLGLEPQHAVQKKKKKNS